MVCIQVPIREASWPLKNSWKLRWRRARRVIRICGAPWGNVDRPPASHYVALHCPATEGGTTVEWSALRHEPSHDHIIRGHDVNPSRKRLGKKSRPSGATAL